MATNATDGTRAARPGSTRKPGAAPKKAASAASPARKAAPRAGANGSAVKHADGGAVIDTADALRTRARGVVDTVREGAQQAALSVARTVRDALPDRKPAAPRKKESGKSDGSGTARVIGVAAAGIAAGLAVNLGRKAVVQAPSVLAGDWLEALKGEHKAALGLFDALEITADTQTHRRTVLLIQLKHALFKHAATEENAIYPALRGAGEKGEADKLNHEHGYVKDYLYQLENMAKDDPDFRPKLAAFRAELEAHIREEEDVVFPSLHGRLGDEKNKALTTAANKEGFKAA